MPRAWGVGVYDAKTLERLYTILPEKEFEDSIDIEKRIYRQTAISLMVSTYGR
ncbi:tricorn protease N-terminal domain protein [Vibrio sp. JCM 18904]|nr:tricorn protease N-terminal domain protein [Vibrio sp. JCM 18904]